MLQHLHSAVQATAEKRRAFQAMSPSEKTELLFAIAAGRVRL